MDCSIRKKVYHLETANKRGHYQVLGTNNSTNNLRLRPVSQLYPKKGIIKVDAGRQGAIFLASSRKNGKDQFVIKVSPFDRRLSGKMQVSALEYKICEKLYRVVPGRVPKPMGFFRCTNFADNSTWNNKNSSFNYSKQTVSCMEYIENGTFGNYLDKMASSPRKRLSDKIMKNFINQVLKTLLKIQKRYPGFRHGDLHLDNLLVRPVKPIPELVLTDFGWSKMSRTGSNPAINTGNWREKYGIGANMSPMYDAHMFLMQMRKWVFRNDTCATDGFVRTKVFLNKYVPMGYREENDTFTRNFRLKYGTKYPFTLRTIVTSGPLPLRILKTKKTLGHKWSNTSLLRLTPSESLNKDTRARRSLLIAYGAGPSPNQRNSRTPTLANPNKPSLQTRFKK